jgi:hypothetical protein
LASLLMLDGLLQWNGPLWSLYMEVWIYGLALMAFLVFERRWIFAVGCVLVAGLWTAHNHNFPVWATIWAIGASTALAPRVALLDRIWRLAGPLAVVSLLVVLAVRPDWFEIAGSRAYVSAGVQVLAGVAYAYWLARTPIGPMPRAAVTTAKLGYTLYVMHFPLLLLAQSLAQGRANTPTSAAIVSVLAGAACLGLCALAARWLERPKYFASLLTLGARSEPLRESA